MRNVSFLILFVLDFNLYSGLIAFIFLEIWNNLLLYTTRIAGSVFIVYKLHFYRKIILLLCFLI